MSIIYTWFKIQKPLVKLLLVIILAVSVFAIIQTARYSISEYKRLKSIEEKYDREFEKMQNHDKEELKIVEDAKQSTTSALKKNEAINQNTADYEKTVDTSSISDDDIYDFISDYNKR